MISSLYVVEATQFAFWLITLLLSKRIADSSKILTNMGLIYATLGEHEAAVAQFIEATNLDQYLAVA